MHVCAHMCCGVGESTRVGGRELQRAQDATHGQTCWSRTQAQHAGLKQTQRMPTATHLAEAEQLDLLRRVRRQVRRKASSRVTAARSTCAAASRSSSHKWRAARCHGAASQAVALVLVLVLPAPGTCVDAVAAAAACTAAAAAGIVAGCCPVLHRAARACLKHGKGHHA